jgi:hypothetical protein
MTEISTKVYLALPTDPEELLLNGGFEELDGVDDFTDWTEEVDGLVEELSNGDFELVTGDAFDDWATHLNGTGTVEDEQVEVHGGDHAVKIVSDGGEFLSGLFQDPGSALGHWYTLSVWVKGGYHLILGDGYTWTYADGIAADWTRVSISHYVTVAAYSAAEAGIMAASNSTLYADDASLYLTGSIEDNALAHAGDHAARIIGAAGTQPYIYQTAVSTPEARAKFSFWSKGSLEYQLYDVTNAVEIYAGAVSGEDWHGTSYQFWIPVDCVSLKVTFTGVQGGIADLDDVSLLEYGEAIWTLSEDVMASPAPAWEYGIAGAGPYDLVASTGTANLTFDNFTLPGKYSPGHANVLAGFEEGMPVKIAVSTDFEVTIPGELLLNGSFEEIV